MIYIYTQELNNQYKIINQLYSMRKSRKTLKLKKQGVHKLIPKSNFKIGDYVMVKINSCTAGTLIGTAVSK